MSARECNIPLHKQFMHCLDGVFDDNNEGIVASLFVRCESLLLVFICGVCSGINRAMGRSECAEDNLKRSLQGVS
jgi:hypothetical protein